MPESRSAEKVPVPFLRTLDDEALRVLISAGGTRDYGVGDTLFHQGDPSRHLLIVHDGWLKVTAVSRSGREALLAIRGPGDIIGELSAVDGRSRGATVRTFTTVRATLLSSERFLLAMAELPDLSLAVMRHIAANLRDADAKRTEYGGSSGHERIIGMLLELSTRYGKAVADGRVISIPLAQRELAAAVGVSREVAARTLRALRERGVLKTARQRIVILRQDLLKMLAKSV